MCVCLSSVTVMQPVKAVERNEMPFGRDTCVILSNIVLHRSPGLIQEGEIWGSEPPVCSDAAYRQTTLVIVVPLLYAERCCHFDLLCDRPMSYAGLGSLLYFSTSLQSKKVLGKSNEVQVKSTLLENYLSKKYKVLC